MSWGVPWAFWRGSGGSGRRIGFKLRKMARALQKLFRPSQPPIRLGADFASISVPSWGGLGAISGTFEAPFWDSF